MNLHIMNEAFKRKYSDILTEAVDPSYKEKLRKALVMKSMEIVANWGTTKQLEIALQEVIKHFFPDKDWWEVTDCNIYLDLLAGSSPREVCDHIVDQMKDECCEESSTDLKEEYSLETIEEKRFYLPVGEGKSDIIVSLISESSDDDTQYAIDIDWGSAAGVADKISKAIWEYSYGDARFIHTETGAEIHRDRFVDSLCTWEDEEYEVIKELYNDVVDGLNNIDTDELDESKPINEGSDDVKSKQVNEAVSNPEKTIGKVDKNLAKEVDKDLVRDLTLILENEGEVYRRSITPVINNLRKKRARGQFDEKLAIQAFFHVVEGALKQPWFYRYYSYSMATVSVPERYAVAKELLDGFMEEIEFEDTSKHENLSISKIRK